MSQSKEYGRYYWCIKVPHSVSESAEIYVYADVHHVDPSGTLVMLRNTEGGKQQATLALAAGSWYAFYLASETEGTPLSVEQWEGEVTWE